MEVREIGMAELKRNLAEAVSRAAFGGQRLVLLSHGRPKAALVSIADLQRLEELDAGEDRVTRMREQDARLQEAAELRRTLAAAGVVTDAAKALDEVRQERIGAIVDLR